MDFRLVPNQSENGKYYLISVYLTRIRGWFIWLRDRCSIFFLFGLLLFPPKAELSIYIYIYIYIMHMYICTPEQDLFKYKAGTSQRTPGVSDSLGIGFQGGPHYGPLKPYQHQDSMVLRGLLWSLNCYPIMPRGVSLSDSRGNFSSIADS